MATRSSGAGLSEGVAIALDAIWNNKLRTFLTVLGNIIAASAIILVVTIIQGLNEEVASLLTAEGADVITVQREGISFSMDDILSMRSRPRLTRADAEALRRHGTTFSTLMEVAWASATVDYRDNSLDSVNIQGTSYEYAFLDTIGLAAGRYFAPMEVSRNRSVVVLGSEIAANLFPGQDPERALGKRVRVRGMLFNVIGVQKEQGSTFGVSEDEFVVLPIGAFQRLYGTRRSLEFKLKSRDPDGVEATIEEARVLMRVRHRLGPRESDDFSIFSSSSLLDLYHQITSGIFMVLVGIVAMALVVSGIVIMNIMLMVVTERTREIGIRKAVGASTQQILWQFLIEAVTLSLTGGIFGILLGYGVATLIAAFSPLPFVLASWSILAALAVVLLVGIGFGMYPASRAAQMDPIVALSHE